MEPLTRLNEKKNGVFGWWLVCGPKMDRVMVKVDCWLGVPLKMKVEWKFRI